MRALPAVGAALGLLATGCWGPWYTTIPTYWPPEPRPRVAKVSEPVDPPAPPIRDSTPPVRDELAMGVPADTPRECLSIYLVSSQRALFAFDPRQNVFELRGALRCPGARWSSPFSMAVSREGVAHVLYNDGSMYAVQVSDASCVATTFERDQPPGYRLFGMGFAVDGQGASSETLYVAETGFGRQSRGLARIGRPTLDLEHIGGFDRNPGSNIELTPTGGGPLYGFFINDPGPGGTLVRIDTETARIAEATFLPVGSHSSSLAISWWGGAFFIFTSGRHGGTDVTRYHQDTGRTKLVATIDQTIVGAGVSTCAPGAAPR